MPDRAVIEVVAVESHGVVVEETDEGVERSAVKYNRSQTNISLKKWTRIHLMNFCQD